MNKIVILGSEGMLGSALALQFASAYEVVGLDRKDVDVTNAEALAIKLNEIKPIVVINATAYNNVDEAERNEEADQLAKKLNGTAVGELAQITKGLHIPLVHFSSEYVFDGANRNGYAEDAVPTPQNKYGQSKLLGETLLQKNTDQFYLVRLSRMFGRAGVSELAKKSFVDTMLDLVEKQGKTELKIVDEEVSCPTYSADLAAFVFDLAHNHRSFGIYHGANSGACTWFELAKKAFEIKGLAPNLIPVKGSEFPRPAKRPAYGELINTKMPQQRGWEEALKEYLS